MDRFFNVLRKTLVGTIALVFAFAVTYTPQQYNQIPKVEAFPVVEVGPSGAANISTAIQTTITAVKEIALDKIAVMIAKTMISSILRSMVTWINSGFKGSPAFIQDLDRFLLDVADEAAGEYIKTLGDIGSFICEPFRLDIQLALAVKYQKARERRQDSCTLSGIVDNVEDFFNSQVDRKNFWEQWVEVTSKPERYTPYGQFMAAEAELNARIVNAKGQQIQISNWGDGFLSSKVCELVEGPSGSSPAFLENGSNELQSTQPINNLNLTTPPLPPDPVTGAMLIPSDSGLAKTDVYGSLASLPPAPTGLLAQAQTSAPAGSAALKGKQRCVISTPGKVISEQLNKALGAGQDSLVAADEINEVISALLGQIANQALTGAAGLLGLSVRQGGSSGGYGSYVDELVREANNQSGSFINQNSREISDKLLAQEDYYDMAVIYIPKLKAVMDAPVTDSRFRGLSTEEITDLKSRAQLSYDDALDVRDTTIVHIAKLKPIVTELDKLESEYALTTTTDVRKREIVSLQTTLVNEGAQYPAYTVYRIRASAKEWGTITGS
ncbi:MAG: hypothetical protein AAB618_00570 [Patescibacteria group bacterium]